MFYKISLLSLLLILPFSSWALPTVDGYVAGVNNGFSHFSTREGLPNSFIEQVCQDERGFLWIATTYGLYRYDGYDVKPFKNSRRHPFFLPSNTVISLASEKGGHLWIGTQEGACRMNLRNGSMRHYLLPDVNHQRVNCFRVTRGGHLYAGTMRGLFRYDAANDTLLPVSALGTVNVQCVVEDDRGDLLVGTWEDGLMRYRPGDAIVMRYVTLPDCRGIFTICRRRDGSVLLGTRDGLVEARFAPDGSLASATTIERGRPVYSLALGKKEGQTFVGCRDGLYMLQPDRTLAPAGITSMVRYMYTDRHGMLWFSTQGEGIYTWSDTKGDFFSTGYGKYIQSVFVTRKGDMFTSFDEGADFNGTMLLHGLHVRSVTARRDTSMYFLSVWNDGLWTAGADGVLKDHYTSENCGFIAGKSLNKTFEDSKGNWWTVGYNGLGVRYADGRGLRFADNDDEEVPDALRRELTDIVEDRDGSLWVLTKDKGLVHLTGSLEHPKHIKYDEYTAQKGNLPVNTPLCMFLDSKGVLWVGTDGAGLCRLDRVGSRFTPLQSDLHLPGDMVCSIQEDDYGHLWIGTNRGLVRLTVQGNHRGKLRIFTMRDGLPDNFFEPRACFELDGTMYFGTGRGLVTFCPVMERPNVSPHRVAITGLLLDGKESEEVVDSILTIPALTKSFTLRFASLTYENQHQCTYTYRLRGYDDEWQTTSADHRRVTYNELSPGRYTFELRATDGDGNWSEVLTLPVIIEPPFWRTWYAYLFYSVLGILLLCYLVSSVRYRMMSRNHLQLFVADDGRTQVVVRHDDGNEAAGGLLPTKRDIRPYEDETRLQRYEDGNENGNENESAEEGRALLTLDIRDINFSRADEDFLRGVVRCVHENLADCNFGMKQIEEKMSMSRTGIFRRLKALTGKTPDSIISDMRAATARRMIDAHDPEVPMSIIDLAFRVGYSDPTDLSTAFIRKYGFLPMEYMEKYLSRDLSPTLSQGEGGKSEE